MFKMLKVIATVISDTFHVLCLVVKIIIISEKFLDTLKNALIISSETHKEV